MIRTFLIATTVVLTSPSVVQAGDFAVQDDRVSFTGPIERGDTAQLLAVFEAQQGADFTLTIESPGGWAVEGIMLLDAMVMYPGKITTVAVGTGAWSAGGMMWLGGDRTLIAPNSVVAFHLSYVEGCFECDTGPINALIGGVMANAAVARGPERWPFMRSLLIDMAECRSQFGPQGFVMFDGNGDKHIGHWWTYYPTAGDNIQEGDNHVGRTDTRAPGATSPAAD